MKYEPALSPKALSRAEKLDALQRRDETTLEKEKINKTIRRQHIREGFVPTERAKALTEKTNIIEFATTWLGISFEERPAQEVVLRVFYGMPLDTAQVALWRAITGGHDREYTPGEEPTEAVLVFGRRSGKSLLTAICTLYESICRAARWKKQLRKAEHGYAVIVATRQKQAEAIIQATCTQLLMDSPKLKQYICGTPSASELTLANGMKIISLPCNSTAGRGLPIFFLALDEVGHYFTEGVKADEKIYTALSFGRSQFPGAKTILPSTPSAKQGLFWDWFNEGFQVPSRVTFQAPTTTMNPKVDAKFLERMKKKDIDTYTREILAQFAERVSAFFSDEILVCAFRLAGDVPVQRGNFYVLGIDQSGLSGRDLFSAAVAHHTTDKGLMVDAVRSWEFTSSADVLAGVKALKDAYCISHAMIDRYAAGWVANALQGLGLEVQVRPALPIVYTNMKNLMLARGVWLPDNAELRDGFVNTVAYYGRNNSLSIGHERSESGHADMADAVATAVWAANMTQEIVEVQTVEVFDTVAAFGGAIRDLG